MTRTVILVGRWAIKIPRTYLFRHDRDLILMQSPFGWWIRGWLANRSEWRQRGRWDVARPVFTLGHLAVVFPRVDEIGVSEMSFLAKYEADEAKPQNWGRDAGTWKLIDFDRSWDVGDRGLVGTIYYGLDEMRARRWMREVQEETHD